MMNVTCAAMKSLKVMGQYVPTAVVWFAARAVWIAVMVMTMADAWEKQEAGWYTHPKKGGITRERDGWYLWRNKQHERFKSIGPFKTMAEAKQFAESRP